MTRRGEWDGWITLGALGLLAAWDFSAGDLAVMRELGNTSGFAWRDVVVLTKLHQASRVIAWLVLAWLGWMAFKPQRWGYRRNSRPQPDSAQRRLWFGITLVCVIGTNIVKHASRTSCPWDLAEFGGAASHVSHWMFWLADGGPGQCFPSGHGSAAFCFITLYFLWRSCDAARAGRYALAVCIAGAIFSLTQVLRGAHYPSHAVWTAWLCWTVCCAADQWQQRQTRLFSSAFRARKLLRIGVD